MTKVEVAGVVFGRGRVGLGIGGIEGDVSRGENWKRWKREGILPLFSFSYFCRKTSQLKRIRERTAGGRLGQMTLLKLDEGKCYSAVFDSGVLQGSFWFVTGICEM